MNLDQLGVSMDNLMAAVQINEDGTVTLNFLEANGRAVVTTAIGGIIRGYEISEVDDVTNLRGTLVFSGLNAARMWLRDEGASSVGKIYYVVNAADADEADVRLATPGARMIIRMGETIDVPFDAKDGVVRIDYIANVAETGANLFYVEGRK